MLRAASAPLVTVLKLSCAPNWRSTSRSWLALGAVHGIFGKSKHSSIHQIAADTEQEQARKREERAKAKQKMAEEAAQRQQQEQVQLWKEQESE